MIQCMCMINWLILGYFVVSIGLTDLSMNVVRKHNKSCTSSNLMNVHNDKCLVQFRGIMEYVTGLDTHCVVMTTLPNKN